MVRRKAVVSRHFHCETGLPWVGWSGLRVILPSHGYCKYVSVLGKPIVPGYSCPSGEKSVIVHFNWTIFSFGTVGI